MKGFVQDIEGLATQNDELLKVRYPARNCQLVLMALKPQEENRSRGKMGAASRPRRSSNCDPRCIRGARVHRGAAQYRQREASD
jgi:hypothetical protein